MWPRRASGHDPGLHRFFQGATWPGAATFHLLTAGLATLMVTEPASMLLTRPAAVTTTLAAGTGASTPWFPSVLRRLGLRHHSAPA